VEWDTNRLREEGVKLDDVVRRVWAANETSILPKRKKYG